MATTVLAATALYVGTDRGVPGWWVFPLVQLVLLGLLIAQDPGRIDRRAPTLKRLRTALLVVMPAGTVLGNGLSRNCKSSSIEAITATTVPMSNAWVRARSPLSAKKSIIDEDQARR